jgi:tetratricopeptide (TPR) repeat protein
MRKTGRIDGPMQRARFASCLFAVMLAALLPLTVPAQQNAVTGARELYLLGREAQDGSELYRAIELYRRSLTVNPAYLEPTIGLAESYFRLGEYQEALSHVSTARRLSPSRTDLSVLEARIMMGLGELDRSERLFTEVLSREPYNLDARLGLAELAVAGGRTDTAERRYLEILDLARADRAALLSLYLLYDSLGRVNAAERYLDLALRNHANDARTQYLAALHYARKNELERAALHVGSALALEPGYAEATLLASELALAQGRPDEAAGRLRAYLSSEPEDPAGWYVLALASEASGAVDDALRYFDRALRLAPEDEIARLAMERMVMRRLPLEDPRRTAAAEYRFQRGMALEARNYFGQAADEYRRGLMIAPYSVSGRLRYAGILGKIGLPGRKLTELEVLRELRSNDPAVVNGIEQAEALLRESVTARWGLDREAFPKTGYRLSLTYAPDQDRTRRPSAAPVVSDYLVSLLSGYGNLELPGAAGAAGFAEAFAAARNAGTEYFMHLTGFDDDGTVFSVEAELYLSRTGTLIASFMKHATGPGRVYRALSSLADAVSNLFPLRGRILDRKFETGLVNLGAGDGMREGVKLLVLPEGSLRLRPDAPGFLYDAADVIGELTVVTADENAAECSIVKRGFFDLVKQGDIVILEGAGRDRVQEESGGTPALFRRILSVR